MKQTKIWIVRHTETVGNVEKRLTGRKSYEITERGKFLIELLTQELSKIKFDKIYSSPAKRAIKTVEPLAKLNQLEIKIADELAEMYFGVYDGWKWEDVNKVQPEIKERQKQINEICGIPEQEEMQEVAERMYRVILKIASENIGKNILVSSHGVAIEAFLRKIVSLPFKDKREEFCQYNVAINKVVMRECQFYIERLADVNYLNCNSERKKKDE